ncbi:hypothetical protein PMAYCL1PPCAC_07801, partial [Pristionchus mayeri]
RRRLGCRRTRHYVDKSNSSLRQFNQSIFFVLYSHESIVEAEICNEMKLIDIAHTIVASDLSHCATLIDGGREGHTSEDRSFSEGNNEIKGPLSTICSEEIV